AERPGLTQLKDHLREGDTLVIWRLDRLGRSLKDLIEWVNYFEEQNIALKSLQESIDTSTPTGKLVFHIFGALAEFERNLIRERSRAGMEAARARGRRGGRPSALSPEQKKLVFKLHQDPEQTIDSIRALFNVSRKTIYNAVNEIKQKQRKEAG
ncbi:MAG: recombinase family protein, partial [Bacteroidota bacterium]